MLLPAQIVTGALMWGVQHWPELALIEHMGAMVTPRQQPHHGVGVLTRV